MKDLTELDVGLILIPEEDLKKEKEVEYLAGTSVKNVRIPFDVFFIE
jgi:hypothetical protein